MMELIKLVCTVIYFLFKPLKCSRNTAASSTRGPAPGGVTRQNRPGGHRRTLHTFFPSPAAN